MEICFANPGTTEMPLVVALDRTPGMRVVLGLFEGVCSGAADGWARMTGRPAATLLHVGPGLANAIANLHNARRARSPVVNWIGEHAGRHLPLGGKPAPRWREAPGSAARVAAASGCPVWVETFPARQECGRHLPHFPPLPYFPEDAAPVLADLEGLVLAGARDPVAFFAYPGQPSRLLPERAGLHVLADPDADVDATAALEALARELGAPAWVGPQPARPDRGPTPRPPSPPTPSAGRWRS